VGLLVSPNSGDVEFQKTLEAMKQVKSFRGAYVMSTSSSQHSERTWEVDCNRNVIHRQMHDLESISDSAYESKQDELLVGDETYTRESDGSWERTGFGAKLYTGKWYCDNLAQGTARDLLPDILTMLRHAAIAKGDKKTVNGVRCREWMFANRSALSAEKGSVCIGLEDHLPYEMTSEDGRSRYTYSDFNASIPIDVPEAALQPASATSETN